MFQWCFEYQQLLQGIFFSTKTDINNLFSSHVYYRGRKCPRVYKFGFTLCSAGFSDRWPLIISPNHGRSTTHLGFFAWSLCRVVKKCETLVGGDTRSGSHTFASEPRQSFIIVYSIKNSFSIGITPHSFSRFYALAIAFHILHSLLWSNKAWNQFQKDAKL